MEERRKDYLPQTEAEWLQTGKFFVETVPIGRNRIRCALAKGSIGDRLVIMVGGIPRDPARRQKLPLINKLYGHLAIKMLGHGIDSVLYNQPATGGSSGEWDEETLQSRSETLAGVVGHFNGLASYTDYALIGTSAGAYIAVTVLNRVSLQGRRISKLALLSPAAYPEKVEDVPYGEEFTQLIREPWNVTESPVFPKLQKFVKGGGHLLVSFFESDDPPIPQRIQELYRAVVRQLEKDCGRASVMIIPGVAHNFRRIGTTENGNIVDNNSIRTTATILGGFLKS